MSGTDFIPEGGSGSGLITSNVGQELYKSNNPFDVPGNPYSSPFGPSLSEENIFISPTGQFRSISQEEAANTWQNYNNDRKKLSSAWDKEDCEECCPERLVLHIKRHTKYVINDEWDATGGTLTIKRVRVSRTIQYGKTQNSTPNNTTFEPPSQNTVEPMITTQMTTPIQSGQSQSSLIIGGESQSNASISTTITKDNGQKQIIPRSLTGNAFDTATIQPDNGPAKGTQTTENVIYTCEVAERGGPGSTESGTEKMIEKGNYGIAALSRRKFTSQKLYERSNPSLRVPGTTDQVYSKHATYNAETPGDYPHKALATWGSGPGMTSGRAGIDIHIARNYKWSEGCILIVGNQEINIETGALKPNWNITQSHTAMKKIIEIIEQFKGRKPGGLPLDKKLTCVDLIIDEPADESGWKEKTI